MTIERIPLNPTLREIKKNFAEQQRDGLMNSEITFEDIRILDIRLADMDDEYWIFEVEFHYQPKSNDDFGLSAHDVESMMIG